MKPYNGHVFIIKETERFLWRIPVPAVCRFVAGAGPLFTRT